MQRNKYLLSGVALAAVLSVPAQAQETAERETAVDRVLQKVTVSATKKKDVENVQDVPISVTAFNSDTLDALNVTTIEDLSYSSPNVSLDDVGTARGTANFAIRGLGVNSSIPSIDPAVGVFIDGVYLGVNNGVVVDLFDVDSIEVLRGPQGCSSAATRRAARWSSIRPPRRTISPTRPAHPSTAPSMMIAAA